MEGYSTDLSEPPGGLKKLTGTPQGISFIDQIDTSKFSAEIRSLLRLLPHQLDPNMSIDQLLKIHGEITAITSQIRETVSRLDNALLREIGRRMSSKET